MFLFCQLSDIERQRTNEIGHINTTTEKYSVYVLSQIFCNHYFVNRFIQPTLVDPADKQLKYFFSGSLSYLRASLKAPSDTLCVEGVR